MPVVKIHKQVVFEDSGASCMARVVGNAATAITQATITSITSHVFDLDSSTPTTDLDNSTLTVSSVVFDTLQTDARWTVDSTGYNFRHDFAASIFTTGGHRYRVEFVFTPSSGAVFHVVYQLKTEALYVS